jgi:acetyl esterase/lipase
MRIGRFAVTVGCLLALAPASVAAAPVTAQVGARSVRDDVYPRLPAPFPGGVTSLADVEYANLTGYRALTLDLYRPKADGEPKPLVVWVHGGGWNRGDARTSGAFADWPRVLAELAGRGFVVASVNYRLSGEAKFPAQIQDVKAAIRFLRANAGRYGIDPARVYAWGGSAGGQLAALAAVTCGVGAFAPLASTGRLPGSEAKLAKPLPQSDCVQGAVIWYGALDLSDMGPNAAQLLGCEPSACPAKAAEASPLTYAARAQVPMVLMHGLDDTEVPPKGAEAMAAGLKASHAPVQTLFIPGVGHGWIGPNAATTRAASLLALRRTFDAFEAWAARKP